MTDLPQGRWGEDVVRGAIHHVGLSVSDLDAAIRFWESFLDTKIRWRAILDRPYLGEHVGYPGIAIAAAFIDLPGGGILELLDYQTERRAAVDEASANPGHMHLCLAVEDIGSVWEKAVACGARPVRPLGPVAVDGGPNRGALAAYLRVPPDWATLELFQPPRTG
jgi:catechol 2,3-dioxygenase-like lactoylglutathione lyase family enzyme